MILDLTREISTDTKVFPGSPLPKFITWNKMDVHNYHSEVVFMSNSYRHTYGCSISFCYWCFINR